MKILLDVQDNKASAFMEMIKELTYIKAESLSVPDSELLEEIREINKAFKNAELIKGGKLHSRPAAELLNEL